MRWSHLQLGKSCWMGPSLSVVSTRSHPTLSSLAQDHWTHRIQAPLTYLQSTHNYPTSVPSYSQPNLHSTSSQYSLFIRRYSCSATFISSSPLKNNWSLLPLCFIMSLESAPFISSSTSFWHQFLHLLLTYSFTYHFFLFWLTILCIYNSVSLSLPA